MCPWCGSVIPHDRFLEIEKKIRDQETQKLQTERRRLGAEFERKLDLARQAAQETAVKEASKELRKIAAERDSAKQKMRELESRGTAERRALREKLEAATRKEVQRVTQQAQTEASRELRKERSSWQRSQLSLESKIKEL